MRIDNKVIGKDVLDMIDFFFNDTATTEIYTLSLHDALPISGIPAFVQTFTNSLLSIFSSLANA